MAGEGGTTGDGGGSKKKKKGKNKGRDRDWQMDRWRKKDQAAEGLFLRL